MGAEHNLPSLENIVMDSPDVKNVTEGRRRGGGGGPGWVWNVDSKCVLWWFLLNKMDKIKFLNFLTYIYKPKTINLEFKNVLTIFKD